MPVMPYYNERKEFESNLNEIRVSRFMTINEVCEKAGVFMSQYGRLCNGTDSPVYLVGKKTGNVKATVKRILGVLKADFEDAFPRYSCKLNSNTAFSNEQILDMAHGEYAAKSLEDLIYNKELKASISKVMTCLSE